MTWIWKGPVLISGAILFIGCGGADTTEIPIVHGVRVTTSTLDPGVVGEGYGASLSATGGVGDYSWEVASGSLPQGLSLDAGGTISGTPERAGEEIFRVRVRSGDLNDEATFSIEVAAAPPPEAVRVAVPPAMAGDWYDVSLLGPGAPTEYEFAITEGALPAGLTLAAAGGISGTPTSPDSVRLAIQIMTPSREYELSIEVRVVAADPERFNIIPFRVDVPEHISPAVDSAIERWERVITGDLSMVEVTPITETDCGGHGGALGTTSVDDVMLVVDLGATVIRNAARPCLIRGSDSLPVVGLLQLTRAGLDSISQLPNRSDAIFHHVGHALGFGGALFELHDLDHNGFSGASAVAEYEALGGSGNVPLEDQGFHWSPERFGPEVMAGGFMSGSALLLSRVTIAAFADLGYEVDLDEADDFSLQPVDP